MEAKRIIICDDDEGILEVLELYLELEGYVVFTVANSTLLIEQIEMHSPDLLLLDLWMPLLSGDQVISLIRENGKIMDLPIIVLSASVDGATIANENGANGFIAKPFDLDDIKANIDRMINKE
ncbi:response regulator [Sphingobacterium sp. 2149]|uniref:response regulator n=1 Tax=Sphingobacterium sp. 2149 TaxID=2817763 RepID=UPI001AE573A1|nr:response regulator [Sphingobacterium sp. 2149]MDR6736714.1 DNA-binding response OmpR family regulator [Sphingobacterium sp. 2149]